MHKNAQGTYRECVFELHLHDLTLLMLRRSLVQQAFKNQCLLGKGKSDLL